jgi:hypothetical protein
MAALTAANIKSTSLEGGILELVQLLQVAELALSPAQNRVQLTINTDTNIATIALQLPLAASVSTTDGSLKYTAAPYA